MKIILSVACVVFVFAFLSCGHYIDKATTGERKIAISQGSLKISPDNNVLFYKNNTKYTLDKESYAAKPFYLVLPKHLKWFEISGSQYFSFYYKSNQVIYIDMDFYHPAANLDTAYVPTNEELIAIVSNSEKGLNRKYDLSNISIIKNRKQLVVKKNCATILLYNIRPENYDVFISDIKKFRVLPSTP